MATMKLESIYYSLPIALQNVLCSIKGRQLQTLRYHGNFNNYQQELESRMFWSPAQITAYRDQRLRDFILHSVRTVPFYRRRFQELGISPKDINGLQDLHLLPILSKEELREHFDELISETVPAKQQIILRTSGTTGTGLRIITTQQVQQEQWAFAWRFRQSHGALRDKWCAYFSSRVVAPLTQTSPPFWRYNYFAKQILFSGFHMSPANLGSYVREIQTKQPFYIQGYPSLISLLAAYIVENHLHIGYTPRCILTNSESLLPHQAEIIHQAFGIHPVQRYSMVEAVAAISECEQGKLHVDEDFSAVEFVPNEDGSAYKVIGTGFTNPAFPLIRYDVGDLVTLSNESCSCGRPGRIVGSIDGRQEDYVLLKNGTRLGRVSRIMQKGENIREAQIHQSVPGEITIRVVRGGNYTEADKVLLLQEAQTLLGPELDIAITYVDHIERSRSGKLRFVISDVPASRL